MRVECQVWELERDGSRAYVKIGDNRTRGSTIGENVILKGLTAEVPRVEVAAECKAVEDKHFGVTDELDVKFTFAEGWEAFMQRKIWRSFLNIME